MRPQQTTTPVLASTSGINPQLSSIDDGYDSDTMIKFRKDVDRSISTMKKECFRQIETRLVGTQKETFERIERIEASYKSQIMETQAGASAIQLD